MDNDTTTPQAATPETTQADVELLDFWAAWCGPCKIMTPVLKELEEEFKSKIVIKELDVDAAENQELVEKYNIMSVPTYIFMKDGEVVDQVVGAQPKDAMVKKLNALLEAKK